MVPYIASLAILLAGSVLMGLWALFYSMSSPRKGVNQTANICGAAISAIACVTGFMGVASGPWDSGAPSELYQFIWGLPFGNAMILLDPLARVFLLPAYGLGFACAAAGAFAFRHERGRGHNLAAHWFFYALLLLGMTTVAGAADAVFFLLAWEVMSLAPFFLIDFNDQDSKVRDASWVYLTAAHLGAALLIAFFVLLWQITGQTALLAAQTSPALKNIDSGMLSFLFLMALLGFGAKAGIAPLHVWLPDAHPAAPAHISALLSGAMINMGLYGLIRSISLLAGPPDLEAGILGLYPVWWGWLLLGLGLLTAFLGIIKAMPQGNLKRLLAYSSVENMGIMFTGLGCGLIGIRNGDAWIAFGGIAGAILHMLNHAGFKGLLFLCAGEVLHATGTIRMELLGGLQKIMPLTGALFALGAVSIACLPPFSGFMGEFVIFLGLANGAGTQAVEQQLGLLLSLGIMALVSGLACALYVKAYGMVFSGAPRSGFSANAHAPSAVTLWPLLIPAAACVGGGLGAPLFIELASSAALSSTPIPRQLMGGCLEAGNIIHASSMKISMIGWSLIGLVAFLWAIRKVLLKKRAARIKPTWNCGFQASSARIQYTPDSFSEPLARIFAPFMGIESHGDNVQGFFPRKASLGLSAPDRTRALLFTPIFEGVEKLCNTCKIIQHGKIHLYILYILATVVCLLVWGLK